MAGELCYFYLRVPDAQKAQSFYGDVFGWRFEPGATDQGFNIVGGDGVPSGQGVPGGLQGGDTAAIVQACFAVDDIEAARQQVIAKGGEAGETQSSGAGGYFAHCKDDQGVEFDLFQFT